MVFTIGDLWDELGDMGVRLKKSVSERPKELKEGILAIPSQYKFHVVRGAGMIGEGLGSTFGGGTRSLFEGIQTGFTEGMTQSGQTSEASLVDRWGSFWGERIPTTTEGANVLKEVISKTADTAKGLIPENLVQFPEGFGTVDLSQLHLGEGLASMGQSLASALSGVTPTIPKVPGLTDEEGKPNYLLMAALAIGGYVIVKKVA